MKRNFGFTLMETLISLALFGVLMLILFTAVNGFQRNWLKEYAKQNVNAQFVRAYRSIDTDVQGTNTTFFHDYKNTENPKEAGRRWFMFPISKTETNTSPGAPPGSISGVTSDGYPIWTHVIVYHLEQAPKDHLCPKDNPEQLNDICPHKLLIRHEIKLAMPPRTTELGDINCNTYMFELAKKIPEIIAAKSKSTIYVTFPVATLSGNYDVTDRRVIETDIVDLTVDSSHDRRVQFNLKILRTIDAQKYITIGTTPLVEITPEGSTMTADAKKYMEETSWITLTNNN